MIKETLAEIQATILGWLHPGFVPMTIGSAYRIYRTTPSKKEATDILISSWLLLYLVGDTVLELPSWCHVPVFFVMGLGAAGIINLVVDNADDIGIGLIIKFLKLKDMNVIKFPEKSEKADSVPKTLCGPIVEQNS